MSSIRTRFFSHLVSLRFPNRMASSNFSYEDAVQKLNTLQSNKSTIEQIKKDIKSRRINTNLKDMENYLYRTGITLSKLDELSIIHVAGTKGKGSTSAMCESILHHHGFRTGFYSSPHLVTLRERIRLNGKTVSKEKFSKQFHQVYNMLEASKAHEHDMPKYFAFLTVLAFNIFLKEQVDVAIIEVGIGGSLDSTNIVRKVPVVGITSLGLDHTSILGNTLSEIAAAKAGIMKYGCEAYTVTQSPEAMEVLQRVAADVECTLTVVPDYKSYSFSGNAKNPVPIELEAYKMNASLAIQLAHAWMRFTKIQTLTRAYSLKKVVSGKIIRLDNFTEIDSPYITDNGKNLDGIILDEPLVSVLPFDTVIGLKECKWPGRYQIIQSYNSTFYLDGAHTKESMEICADWFKSSNSSQHKILVFSATGDRDVEVLLKPLKDIGYDTVFFVIPNAHKKVNKKSDNYSVMEQKEMLERCHRYARIYKGLCKNSSSSNIKVLECVSDALISIKQESSAMGHSSVLITGSLYLVGAALSILDPCLSKD